MASFAPAGTAALLHAVSPPPMPAALADSSSSAEWHVIYRPSSTRPPMLIGECPVWCAEQQALLCVDIDGKSVHRIAGIFQQRTAAGADTSNHHRSANARSPSTSSSFLSSPAAASASSFTVCPSPHHSRVDLPWQVGSLGLAASCESTTQSSSGSGPFPPSASSSEPLLWLATSVGVHLLSFSLARSTLLLPLLDAADTRANDARVHPSGDLLLGTLVSRSDAAARRGRGHLLRCCGRRAACMGALNRLEWQAQALISGATLSNGLDFALQPGDDGMPCLGALLPCQRAGLPAPTRRGHSSGVNPAGLSNASAVSGGGSSCTLVWTDSARASAELFDLHGLPTAGASSSASCSRSGQRRVCGGYVGSQEGVVTLSHRRIAPGCDFSAPTAAASHNVAAASAFVSPSSSQAAPVAAARADAAAGPHSSSSAPVSAVPAASSGMPDGLCLDSEGCLWIALNGAGLVLRVCGCGCGRVLRRLSLPVSKVTSLCFGGATMRSLFVTSAAKGANLTAEPLAGSVLMLTDAGVAGRHSHRLAGRFSMDPKLTPREITQHTITHTKQEEALRAKL